MATTFTLLLWLCAFEQAAYCATIGDKAKCNAIDFCWYQASTRSCVVDYSPGEEYHRQASRYKVS
jgi:hypothetical protein